MRLDLTLLMFITLPYSFLRLFTLCFSPPKTLGKQTSDIPPPAETDIPVYFIQALIGIRKGILNEGSARLTAAVYRGRYEEARTHTIYSHNSISRSQYSRLWRLNKQNEATLFPATLCNHKQRETHTWVTEFEYPCCKQLVARWKSSFSLTMCADAQPCTTTLQQTAVLSSLTPKTHAARWFCVTSPSVTMTSTKQVRL